MKPTWINLLRHAYQGSRDKSLGQRAEVLTGLIGAKTPVNRLTNSTLTEIVGDLQAKGLTGSTVNRYLSIVSRVVTLYRKGYNPSFTLLIPWQREGSGRFAWLRKEDQPTVVNCLISNGQPDVALSVEILVATGMRLGEFLALERPQVEDRWIRLWETKTNRPRSIPIQPVMAERLRGLIERGIPPAHTIRRELKKALDSCEIKGNITPHSLRHTTATRLIQAGASVLVTKDYLGHASLKTTQRYVHIEDADLTKAMELLTE